MGYFTSVTTNNNSSNNYNTVQEFNFSCKIDNLQVNVTMPDFDMPLATRITTLASYADDTDSSQIIQNPRDVAELQKLLDSSYRLTEVNSVHFNGERFPSPALPVFKTEYEAYRVQGLTVNYNYRA